MTDSPTIDDSPHQDPEKITEAVKAVFPKAQSVRIERDAEQPGNITISLGYGPYGEPTSLAQLEKVAKLLGTRDVRVSSEDLDTPVGSGQMVYIQASGTPNQSERVPGSMPSEFRASPTS